MFWMWREQKGIRQYLCQRDLKKSGRVLYNDGIQTLLWRGDAIMSKFTQKVIMQTFLDILEHKSLDKITVKDIIETAEVNRNTFYYYFDDIYDLIDRIFEQELETVISEAKEESSFYEEYIRAASILIDHRQAIIHIYNSKSREILFDYMQKTTDAFVVRFVRKAAADYDISEEGVEFITYFYSSAIIGNTMRWLKDGMPFYREKLLKCISDAFEATIDNMIGSYVKSGN